MPLVACVPSFSEGRRPEVIDLPRRRRIATPRCEIGEIPRQYEKSAAGREKHLQPRQFVVRQALDVGDVKK